MVEDENGNIVSIPGSFVFDLFDPADPAVIAGRRNLASALY